MISGQTGIIQTMNFGDNGRHLADQDYNICMRQEAEMCTIAYEPCHENAFRISPNTDNIVDPAEFGSGDGMDMIESRQTEICGDKIIVPCESDDFIMVRITFYITVVKNEQKNFDHFGFTSCQINQFQ